MLHRSRTMIFLAVLAVTFGTLVACGHDDAGLHEAVEEVHEALDNGEDAAAESGDGAPRVFFVGLSNGDEVTSPVSLEFGIENFEIVAAQDPIVIEEGKGHHHLGVNTHCEEPGVILVKAEPWVHFGDGSNTIDMQLPPGPAHLALQVGDGEHRTLDEPGLCAMISLNVVEENAVEEEGAE